MAGPKVGRNSREPALYGGGVGCEETVVEKNIEKTIPRYKIIRVW